MTANGVFPVRIRCLLPDPCEGALVVVDPNNMVPGLPMDQWIAGSDFRAAPGQASTVDIALTKLGKRLTSSSDGYRGAVFIAVKGYAPVANGEDTILLRHS